MDSVLTPLEFSTTTQKPLNCNFDTFLLLLSKIHVKISSLYIVFILLTLFYTNWTTKASQRITLFYTNWTTKASQRKVEAVKSTLTNYTSRGSNATNHRRLTSALVYFKQLVVRLIQKWEQQSNIGRKLQSRSSANFIPVG